MRPWTLIVLCGTALLTLAGLLVGQEQGPNRDPGATVARPRRPDSSNTTPDADLPPIPSKLSKKNETDTTGLATFKSDVEVVSVDAAVLDNQGRFIPGIPRRQFPRARGQRSAADQGC